MSLITPGQDLDLSFLTEIADGSDEFIVESIDMFLEHTPELLRAISDSIAVGDCEATALAAHKLKPNLGFFGMNISQETLQEIEHLAKAGSPPPGLLQSKFNEVQEIIVANLITLKKIRAEKAASD